MSWQRTLTLLTALTMVALFSTPALILIVRVPARPSWVKDISMPSMRRNVCARRSRPARAPGFFGQPVRSLAVTAEIGAGPQKVCVPIHESHSTMISRTQAATGSASRFA